jgi:hypothetical protein
MTSATRRGTPIRAGRLSGSVSQVDDWGSGGAPCVAISSVASLSCRCTFSLHVFGPIIGIVIIFGVVLVLVALGGP